jgi:hypothetical protein
MAGNAAGIAKARAAQAAKREERARMRIEEARRRRELEQAQQHSQQPQQETNSEPTAPALDVLPAVATVDDLPAPDVSKSQQFALSAVDAAAPEAVAVLVQSMRNRKSPTLRFSAACKILDLSIGRDRGKGAGEAAEEVAIDRIAQALQLRARTLDAVDVTPESVKKS